MSSARCRVPIEEITIWIDQCLKEFHDVGIHVSAPAESLLRSAVNSQLDEGIISDQQTLVRLLRRMGAREIVMLYAIKYGERALTFNRAVRLLADLHDRWIRVRDDDQAEQRRESSD